MCIKLYAALEIYSQAFAIPNIVSVIVIGFVLGAAIVSIQRRSKATTGAATVLAFCREMSIITNEIIGWIIVLAPMCIGFLIAASLASAGKCTVLLMLLLGCMPTLISFHRQCHRFTSNCGSLYCLSYDWPASTYTCSTTNCVLLVYWGR